MTLHVAVLGIDGSGKSTVATALPTLLAAELHIRAGSAGDSFCMSEAEEDLLSPRFHPLGLSFTGHLAKGFKRLAKLVVDNRHLYPVIKPCQMIFQDDAACRLSRRYSAEVMVSDGNVLLSSMGRVINYLSPASDRDSTGASIADTEVLKAVFQCLLDGKTLSNDIRERLPGLEKAAAAMKLVRGIGLHAGWLPDVVIFLDISPQIAMKRIAARGKRVDRHENLEDLSQARNMYLKTLDAFSQYRLSAVMHRMVTDNMTPGEILQAAVGAVKPHVLALRSERKVNGLPLGASDAKVTSSSVWRRLFNFRYLFGYLVNNWFKGAWREPTFLFSGLGNLLRREGYSAGVMRAIYEQDNKRYGFMDRVFLEYPLHRAVYDRLHILVEKIEAELETRLAKGQDVNIFTAPSGFAYDLFRPLEVIAARNPDSMKRIRLVAADLDPYGHLEKELINRAAKLGLRFEFLRGDITDSRTRSKFEQAAPYDVVLFVGLSSWLPKPQTLGHLEWVRRNIKHDGILVSDCFTADFYAISGWHFGYKANYYTPEIYRSVMDYCGFDGLKAPVYSGRDKINHVMLFSPL